MAVLCSVCAAQTNVPPEPKRKKPKSCKVVLNGVPCPFPLTCEGKTNRANCLLRTGGDPEEKIKRKIPNRIKSKMCRVCRTRGCKGSEKRYLCTGRESDEEIQSVSEDVRGNGEIIENVGRIAAV